MNNAKAKRRLWWVLDSIARCPGSVPYDEYLRSCKHAVRLWMRRQILQDVGRDVTGSIGFSGGEKLTLGPGVLSIVKKGKGGKA